MDASSREYRKAVRCLCEELQSGRIPVGGRLPTERALAEQLQISRNSTREALHTLETIGIIERRQGSGSYYTDHSSHKLSEMLRLLLLIRRVEPRDVCDFRRSMEKSVCLSLMERDVLDLSAAEALLSKHPQTVDEEVENDRAFHYLLVQATGNSFGIELMNAVCDVYRDWVDAVLRVADADVKHRFNVVHNRILEALRQKDVALCEAAVNEHYDLVDAALSKQNTAS